MTPAWAKRYVTRPGEWIAPGRGGWTLWWLTSVKYVVRLRLAQTDEGIVTTALYIEAVPDISGLLGPLAPRELREVTPGRVQTIVNSPEYRGDVHAAIDALVGPDFDPTTVDIESAKETAEGLPFAVGPTTYRVCVPEERSYTDDFYREVSQVVAFAAQRTYRPAGAVADASGVPVTTVHRWLKEARQRGILMRPQRARTSDPAT